MPPRVRAFVTQVYGARVWTRASLPLLTIHQGAQLAGPASRA